MNSFHGGRMDSNEILNNQGCQTAYPSMPGQGLTCDGLIIVVMLMRERMAIGGSSKL